MAYEDYSKLNFTQGYSGFGNSYIPSWNANSQWNNFSNLNSTFGWNGANSFSNWGTPTWGESTFNQVPAGSSASSVNTANLSPDEIEALQRKERSEKVKSIIEKEQALEIEATGLGVTKSELKQIKDVAGLKAIDETKGLSLGEEIGSYTALGALSSVGIMTPVTNARVYFGGEHNNLFSKATDIYNSGHSYNEVFKKNSKIMSEAKAAMRKADKLCNIKMKVKGRLDRSLYDEMAKDMKNALKQLAADPNNAAAQQKLKDLTASINKTTSQRIGCIRSFNKKTMNGIRRLRGKSPVAIEQPNVSTYNAAKQAQTAASQTAQTGVQTASKGVKFIKGCGKLLKKAPILLVAFELFADKDKISAAYNESSSTGNKQLGKSILKAGGAAAGMAIGGKLGLMLGSVVPGVGNIVGGLIGAVAGFAIGGLMSWGGRWLGEQAGDILIDGKDIGAIAMAKPITQAKTQEQLTCAVETVTWAKENQDKLNSAQRAAIAKLEQNLQTAGYIQAEQAEVATA